MVNIIRAIYLQDINKWFCLKFCVGSQVWYKTPEEGQRMHLPKCGYSNEDEDTSLNTLSDKKIQLNCLDFVH